MRTMIVLAGIGVVGAVAWLMGSRLSADALGMALGISLGVLAGVPTALLLLVAGRRRHSEPEYDEESSQVRRLGPAGYPAYPHQAPVIVLAPPAAPWPPPGSQAEYGAQPVRGALPGPTAAPASSGRVFRLVGERDEVLEEF